SHPASILLFGRSGASLFDRESQATRTKSHSDAWPCGVAVFVVDCSRHFSALASFAPDLLHFRRHTHPDRIGVRVSVFARLHPGANASDHTWCDSGWFLGGICTISGAGSEFRLSAGWSSTELGAQLHRIFRPLEQKLESFVGIRRLVSESLSERTSVRFQPRRLVNLELHSYARDDDSRAADRRMA